MTQLDQNKAPIAEAMITHTHKRTVAFDVPGHKQGKGNPMLREFLGDKCLRFDMNSRKDLDNLCHPVGVILEAEEIAAQAFGAGHAFFIVNGTTAAVQAMVMNVARKEEKIILPRNVHRSAIYALILTGAIPVYVNPGVHPKLGIPLGMQLKDVEEAILKNPDAKAVFVNNPTYYGICSDLPAIVELAHRHNMKVIVDEAHGTHFYFKLSLIHISEPTRPY
jgi:arginine/lysine/ornithine decarboxylase